MFGIWLNIFSIVCQVHLVVLCCDYAVHVEGGEKTVCHLKWDCSSNLCCFKIAICHLNLLCNKKICYLMQNHVRSKIKL